MLETPARLGWVCQAAGGFAVPALGWSYPLPLLGRAQGRVAEPGSNRRLSASLPTRSHVSACIPGFGAVALPWQSPAGCLPDSEHKPHRLPFLLAAGMVNSRSSCQIQAATVTCCESLTRNKLAQSVQALCWGKKRCWLGFVQQISRLGSCRLCCCRCAAP